MNEIIRTSRAPAAIGPYSQAVRSGEFLFVSGQLGIDPKKGQLVEGIEAQTERAMDNLTEVLDAAGMTLDDVIKTTIYVKDLGDFTTVNEIYGSRFEKNFPARATIQVAKLPLDGLVEIEAIARKA